MTVDAVTFESDWLPPAELERLISEQQAQFPALTVSTSDPGHRGLDPAVAVAVVTGLFGLAIPFVAKLAERLFAREPRASVTFERADGSDPLVVRATLPAQARDRIVEQAIASGLVRVQISLAAPE